MVDLAVAAVDTGIAVAISGKVINRSITILVYFFGFCIKISN
jgi:hypothetical protein